MDNDSKKVEQEFLNSINESSKIIYKLARLYFKDTDEQADFRQDVLVNAWRAYSKFRNESKFSTWVYKIAINTAFLHIRNRKTMNEVQLSEMQDELTYEPSSNENQDRLLLAAEFLNENEKALLTLYLEDLTYDQISDVLGISVNLVGVRLNRLREKLKTIIQNQK